MSFLHGTEKDIGAILTNERLVEKNIGRVRQDITIIQKRDERLASEEQEILEKVRDTHNRLSKLIHERTGKISPAKAKKLLREQKRLEAEKDKLAHLLLIDMKKRRAELPLLYRDFVKLEELLEKKQKIQKAFIDKIKLHIKTYRKRFK